MRVVSINNGISFGRGLSMAIPTDIGKRKSVNSVSGTPTFGIKPIAVPICDSFIHIFK